MSEKEFELYLSLLSRFLRLSPSQRAEIADELRDHLEARLEELTAQGLSREDAIRLALDEFGDAAELSTHFTQLAQQRRRRLIMRITAGSVLTVAAILLLALFLQPEMPPQPVGARLVGQQDPAHIDDETSETQAEAPATDEARTLVGLAASERVERKLREPIDLNDASDNLFDALDLISRVMEVDIFTDWAELENQGVQREQSVSLQFEYTRVSAATFLDMLLDPLELGYRVRDGFIVVTAQIALAEDAEFLEFRVYNVRDLVQQPVVEGNGVRVRLPGRTAADLIKLVRLAKSCAWEDEDGFGGTVTDFDGLLVVLQTQQAHREIVELLELVRRADAERPSTAVEHAIKPFAERADSGFQPRHTKFKDGAAEEAAP